jgi:hypothetical protein
MSLTDVRPGLRAYLLADSAISALVGSRMYPITPPQGQVLAHIVYHMISGQGDRHMQGRSGLSRPRIQIDCWADTPDVAISLAGEVKERIDGFKGAMAWGTNSPQNSVDVQAIFFESERDDYDADSGLYLISHDYIVWFEES